MIYVLGFLGADTVLYLLLQGLVQFANWGLGKTVGFKLPTNVTDRLLQRIRPASLSSPDRYLNTRLAESTTTFLQGMDFLTEKYGLEPKVAFETMIKYLATRKRYSGKEIGRRMAVDALSFEGYYDLKSEEIPEIEARYGLTLDQMDYSVVKVAAKLNDKETT